MKTVIIWRLRQEFLTVEIEACTSEDAVDMVRERYGNGTYDDAEWGVGEVYHQDPDEAELNIPSPDFQQLGDDE